MIRRILHIIPTLDRGGAEKQLVLLAAGLPRDRFDVRVIALTHAGPLAADLEAAGIPLEVVGKRWKLDPLAWMRLERIIARAKPDLVQTWLFAANSYGRSAALAAGVRQIVGGERCVDLWKMPHELAIDRFLAKRTGPIVVNSGGVSDWYAGHGLPRDKFAVIPNGIRLPAPSRITKQELLAELGLPPSSRLIGAVGRLWPQKRIEDLIWASDLLKVVRSDVHLLVIGDGPQRSKLLRFRRQVCVEERVHLLGERSDVPDLLPHFDLLWLASGYEGLPNVVMEAMAAGIPVVATDIPGTRDLVVPGETGYMVPIGDRAEFARAAQRILNNPELQSRLGAAGQARIVAEFSIERMIERYVAFYERLLAGPK